MEQKTQQLFFRGINNEVANAAVIIDHQGKTNDSKKAIIIVAKKL